MPALRPDSFPTRRIAFRPRFLRLASDWHFDRHHGADPENFLAAFPPLPEDPQTLLLVAGDSARRGWLNGEPGQRWLRSLSSRFGAAALCLGNNEAWDGSADFLRHPLSESAALFRSAADPFPNVFCLEGEILELANCAVAASALWSDYRGSPSLLREELLREASPERFLAGLESPGLPLEPEPTPRRLQHENRLARDMLLSDRWGSGKIRIALTHFPPHPASWPVRDPLDPAFLQILARASSDLGPALADSGIRFWLHGHSHHVCDWPAGSCRVASNPFASSTCLCGSCRFDPLWRAALD